jgi:hypothetical protein
MRRSIDSCSLYLYSLFLADSIWRSRMDQRQYPGGSTPSSVDAAGTPLPRLTPQSLRALLSNLHRPHRLDTPEIRTILRAHGRSPSKTTPTAIGAAAVSLIRDKVAALEAPSGSTWAQRMPHAVLETCFLRGLKNYQAAQELGISERQLSRERTRALQLLAEELAPPSPLSASPDRVPSTDGHLGRGALVRRLAELAAKERLVAVVGRRGTGKTSTVAALARLVRSDLVWWLRVRPGLKTPSKRFCSNSTARRYPG